MNLARRSAWVFDLDGTLTLAVHDFDAIRLELDLPPGKPILEALAALPEAEAAPRRERLDALELELAHAACAAPGAAQLLEDLQSRGVRRGILTRNSHRNALATLEACGLDRYFEPVEILGRDEAPPKPDPAGVLHLLERWRVAAGRSVVVGDYLFDLRAGRAAGTATVCVDPDGHGQWDDEVDLRVAGLSELTRHLA